MPVFHIRLEIGASGLRHHSSIAQHAHLTMVTHGVRDGRWALFPQARVEGVARAVAEEVSAVQARPCPPFFHAFSPLIPVAAMLLVAPFLFGFTVSATWLGERMPVSQEHKTPVKSVARGGAILVVVGLLPWIGTAALILAAAISAGATLLSRFGRTVAVAA